MECLGNFEDLCLWHAASLFHLLRRPFRQALFFDFVHTVDTVIDIFLVFPTILEDMVQEAKQESNIGA